MPALLTPARRFRDAASALFLCGVTVGLFGLPPIASAQGGRVSVLATRSGEGPRSYLDDQNPIADPMLSPEGVLTFRNLAVDGGREAAPVEYRAVWFALDNISGSEARIGATVGSGSMIDAPRTLPRIEGLAVRVDISSIGGPAAWEVPVQAYFVCDHGQWRLVGFERPCDEAGGAASPGPLGPEP